MKMKTKKPVIIVGGGIAGLAVAEALDENGLASVIVERQDTLGGLVRGWSCMATDRCIGCFCCKVDDLIHKVSSSERIIAETGSELSHVERKGSEIIRVGVRSLRSGTERVFDASAVVAAVGFEPFDPSEKVFWGYGRLSGVITLADLNRIMMQDSITQEMGKGNHPLNMAFFQCVGSRDKTVNANYCSQHCCKASLRMAIKLKHLFPQWNLTIYYIDLQLAGKMAATLLKEATEKGIRLLQGVPGEVTQGQDGTLDVIMERNGQNVREAFDRVVLSIGQRPSSSMGSLAEILDMPLDQFGFAAHESPVQPCRTSVPGVYLAGTCSVPGDIEKTLLHAGQTAAIVIADHAAL